MGKHSYTVCEDQPKLDRWEVEIRTFKTVKSAEPYIRKHYSEQERNGETDMCKPTIREDYNGEIISVYGL